MRFSYFTVITRRKCGRSFSKVSCATSQCSTSEANPVGLHFSVASETATGCRSMITNQEFGKTLCRKRVHRILGGDFSSRKRFDRSKNGNHSSASRVLFSGVRNSDSSVRFASGENANLPGPPQKIAGG